MKKAFVILSIVFQISCNSENGNDCLQTAGNIVQKEFTVGDFSKIRIEDEVALFIKQGDVPNVIVESGENLFNDISVFIDEDFLVITDGNSCNLFRDYAITKVYVTAPNITEIRNSASFDVISEGVLIYPNLSLISNSETGPENIKKSGDFILNVECNDFFVQANGQSIFYISGKSKNANLNFSDERPRFEGENFIVDNLKVSQRSGNKMIVNPINEITGTIFGVGDVISVNHPPIIEVNELFTGRLLFKD